MLCARDKEKKVDEASTIDKETENGGETDKDHNSCLKCGGCFQGARESQGI